MTIGSEFVYTRLGFYGMMLMVGQAIAGGINLWSEPKDQLALFMVVSSVVVSFLCWFSWRTSLRYERHQPSLDFWERLSEEQCKEVLRCYTAGDFEETARLCAAWKVTVLRWERELDEAHGRKKR